MKRISAVLVSLFLLTSTVSANAEDDSTIQVQRPNIVLIMADDLGFETIGAYGGVSYKTPVLDDLARQGVRFEHCYAQPLCTPTRVKLMTGQSNIRNYVDFGVLHRSQKTFANLFRDSGYATCIVGKWQLGTELDGPKHFGFAEHCLWHFETRKERFPNPVLTTNGKTKQYINGEYGPDIVSQYGMDFIRRNKDRPFLLYYPMILTHCPFCPTPDSQDWDPKSKGSPKYKGDPKYFGDMVFYMDKIVGQLLTCLEETGVRDHTIVIFVGDNGTDRPIVSKLEDGREIAGAKNKTIDAGMRVPLIVDWPGRAAKGRVVGDLVDMSDFLPTICQAGGIELPNDFIVDGQSFLPQVKGQTGKPRDSIYVWYSRNGEKKKNFVPKVFARNQQYKLYASGQFFDVVSDPLEEQPLNIESLDDEVRDVRNQLQTRIDHYKGLRLSSIKQVKTDS